MSAQFYAHTSPNELNLPFPKGCQELAVHLRQVADLASEYARLVRPPIPGEEEKQRQARETFYSLASLAGMLHDLGKFRDEFQEYLKAGDRAKRPAETAHSVYGAAAAWHRFGSPAIAFAVAGHQAGLHDCSHLDPLVNGDKYHVKQRFSGLLKRADSEPKLAQFPGLETTQLMKTTRTRYDDTNSRPECRFPFWSMLIASTRKNGMRNNASAGPGNDQLSPFTRIACCHASRPLEGRRMPLVFGIFCGVAGHVAAARWLVESKPLPQTAAI